MTDYKRVPITKDNPETASLARNIEAGFLPDNARCWEKEVDDGRLRVIRTIEPIYPEGVSVMTEGAPRTPERWVKHVSISHSGPDNQPGRYPTWDEQKEAVWAFAPGVRMYSVMPAEGTPYVNLHSTTFHWWEEV